MRQKKAAVWSFFTVQEDSRLASCNTCKQAISCGGKMAKTFNTTNLVLHLKSKHPEVFHQYEGRQKELKMGGLVEDKGKGKMSQMMQQDSFECTKLFDVIYSRAQIIHKHTL